MFVELLSITPDAEKLIETAGRTCYKSEHKITENSSGNFIKHLIAKGHESVLEHACATFRINEISRACSHQLVRHRLASYSQSSQRYCDEDDFKYHIPLSLLSDDNLRAAYKDKMAELNELYRFLRKNGIQKQDARYVLPNACYTEIVMTANFREWRHIIKQRLHNSAQQEIRTLARIILEKLVNEAKNCFEDLK